MCSKSKHKLYNLDWSKNKIVFVLKIRKPGNALFPFTHTHVVNWLFADGIYWLSFKYMNKHDYWQYYFDVKNVQMNEWIWIEVSLCSILFFLGLYLFLQVQLPLSLAIVKFSHFLISGWGKFRIFSDRLCPNRDPADRSIILTSTIIISLLCTTLLS